MNFHNFLFVFWGGGGIFTDWHCTVLFLTMSQHVFAPFGRPSFWTLLLRIIRIRVLIIQNGKKNFFFVQNVWFISNFNSDCNLQCHQFSQKKTKLYEIVFSFTLGFWFVKYNEKVLQWKSTAMKKYCNEKILQWKSTAMKKYCNE